MSSIHEAYLTVMMINEELHPELQAIMNSNSIDPKYKLNQVVKHARNLIASGQDTGMESDKPKKGSSRAVFFPKDKKEITLDGAKTKTHTAVKIAFPGQLDKYHGEETLLGQDQNRLEKDHYINQTYGLLQHDSNTGEYHTNEHGILAPVFDSHIDDHHLEMGRVDKFNAKDMANATKTKDFPKGIKLDELAATLQYHHNQAHGDRNPVPYGHTEERLEKLSDHPLVENAISMMGDSGLHPGDISPRNMGIYTHPVTGKKHPVMIDWGFSNDIARKYQKARKKLSESRHRQW